MAECERKGAFLDLNRLNAITDGIFAIAMTILVLNLDIPNSDQINNISLKDFLITQIPELQAYVLSFIMLGSYWMLHHQIHSNFCRTTTTHIWLNLITLMIISLIPYATEVLGEFPHDKTIQIIYSLMIFLIGLFYFMNLNYGIRKHRLSETELSQKFIANMRLRTMISPTIGLCAVGVAFVSKAIWPFTFLIIPVIIALLKSKAAKE